jgi:hypothetical protein
MSLPPIEIRWGGGKWPRNRRRSVQPTVHTGLELARDVVSEMDISCVLPKVATVWCTGESWGEEGGANIGDPTNLELYLPYVDIKRRKVGRWLPAIVTSSVHELLHLAREEAGVDTSSLVGRIADEAVANFGEFIATRLLTKEEIAFCYQRIHPATIPSHVNASLPEGLRIDAAYLNALYGDDRYDEVFDRLESAWLDPQYDGTLSAGEMLGVSCVAGLVSRGVPFAQVVQMPGEKILGIE